MNRDELAGRPAGLPPICTAARHGTMVMTVDALAGGAWMGAHSDGLVVCLLNRTVTGDHHPRFPTTSRGLVVPEAVQAGSATAVPALLEMLDLGTVLPFTVMAADALDTVIVSWNGRELRVEPGTAIRCSSGLGDARVDGPRQSVWKDAIRNGITPAHQDDWHRSRFGADSAAWVLMSRPGARTVSRSLVEIDPQRIRLEDSPLDDAGIELAHHAVEIQR